MESDDDTYYRGDERRMIRARNGRRGRRRVDVHDTGQQGNKRASINAFLPVRLIVIK